MTWFVLKYFHIFKWIFINTTKTWASASLTEIVNNHKLFTIHKFISFQNLGLFLTMHLHENLSHTFFNQLFSTALLNSYLFLSYNWNFTVQICPEKQVLCQRNIWKWHLDPSVYIKYYTHTGPELGHHSSRADSRFAPSQWETALLCNAVSHWLGTNLESALLITVSADVLAPYGARPSADTVLTTKQLCFFLKTFLWLSMIHLPYRMIFFLKTADEIL